MSPTAEAMGHPTGRGGDVLKPFAQQLARQAMESGKKPPDLREPTAGG
ncbi:MAG: hypothetical protein ABIG44_10505 [Planctomycetota bacterium]